ncbi:MAG: S-layer homology domain-containing protein [Clostridia bacterium]|nr:S-layer homology domain-containing protein [Clostridia bacterium]
MKRIIAILLILALCIGTTAVFADAAEDVVVESEDTILKKDIDYTLTYRDNVDPGTATVTIKFIGNYAGEMERTFEIKKAKRTSSGGGGRGGSHVVVVEPVTKYDPPYITGYEDHTFHPESAITRAEATTAIARAISLDTQENGDAAFDDVASHWAKGYINAAADLNIVNGYEDGKFRPDENITRAEFAKIIAKLSEKEIPKKSASFPDAKGHWAESYVAVLAEKGGVTGYEDNTFRPDKPITRAEAVAIINRAVTRNIAPDLAMPFTDVTPEHWAYQDILKAAGIEKKGIYYEK